MDQYRLASTSQDYKNCHAFLRKFPMEGDKDRTLNFPTVAAIRDGEIIGLIGTADLKQAKRVVANTLRVDPTIGNTVFIVKSLIESYETIMKAAGMKWY